MTRIKNVVLKGYILALAETEPYGRKQVVSTYATCPAKLIVDYEYIDIYRRDCSELYWDEENIKIFAPGEYYVIDANGDKREGNAKIRKIIQLLDEDLQYND